MKIVLVYPPPVPLVTRGHENDDSPMGLGLLYLATMVKQNHDVTILGGMGNRLTPEEMIERIEGLHPDVLGISTIFSTLLIGGKIVAQEIKRKLPGTTIIFGGNHATFTAEELIKETYIDIIVMGEGEFTFKELIERLDRKQSYHDVQGIVYCQSGKVIRTPPRPLLQDINTLPFPDFSIQQSKMPQQIPMCSSRGCPHDCIYCSTTSFWGRKWRARSPQNLIDEFHGIFDTFKPVKRELMVGFIDDNFTVNRNRVFEFCRLLSYEDFRLKWGVSSRLEFIDKELVQTMAEVGCASLFFGIESGSERVLKQMNRHYSPGEALEKVEMCVDLGIIPTCSFMIGNPFEDRSDIEKSFQLIRTLKSYKVQVHIFTPLIGTNLYTDKDAFGVEILTAKNETMNLESKALLNTHYLKATEIEELYNKGVGYVLRRHREGVSLEKIAERNREIQWKKRHLTIKTELLAS